MWNTIKQAGEAIFNFFLRFQRTQNQVNLSNKTLFFFLSQKSNYIIQLCSIAAYTKTN